MKKIISIIIFIISIVFSLTGIFFIRATVITPLELENYKGLLFLMGIIFFSLGIFLWGLSKRVKSISASKIMQIDKRPPVLFLRSFLDEKKSFRRENSAIIQYISLMGSMIPQNLNTEEEQLTMVLSGIGPTICIGKPGDFLPPPGMYRDYIPDEYWKDKIKELIRVAQLILIRANETEGLKWEIEYVWNHGDRRKMIFLLPEKQKMADSFNQLLSTIIGKPVPAYTVEWLTDNFSGILYFDEKCNPKVISIKNQKFRFGNLIALRLKKTLEILPAEIIHFENCKLANKMDRIYALAYDGLIMAGTALIPTIIVLYYKGYKDASLVFFLSTIAFYIVYSFFIDMNYEGTTFGKKRFNLKLMDKAQIAPTFQQVFARNLFKLTGFAIFHIDIILFFITGNYMHDYLTATRIFKASTNQVIK